MLIVALIVFGPKRLPELGSSLGNGLRELKSSVSIDGADQMDERERDRFATEKTTTDERNQKA